MTQQKKTPGLISLQVKGGRPPALSRKEWNTVAGLLNNIQIICPQTDGQTVMGPKAADVKLGDGGLIITMPPQFNTLSPVAGSGGGASVYQFTIVSDGGDWWVCSDGSNTWYVIKSQKLRAGANAITSETIRGTTYAYTYTGVTVGGVTGYYTRTVKVSGTTIETDYTIPDPLAGNYIYAVTCNSTILASNAPPSNPSSIGQLIDLNVDGRFWGQ